MEEEENMLYVQDCPGCDHWRDYDYIGDWGDWKVYRCPICGMVRLVQKATKVVK